MKALELDDLSVEFEITSNRPDCLSMIGLARETAATAGEYAGQMVDTARLRGRLFALRTDINGLLHTAGRLVYDAHRGSTGGEDALEQVFSELDRKEAAAAELRSRLERLRQEKPL